MAKLVENADIYAYLDLEADVDDPNTIIPGIRDSVEALLEEQTSQIFGPEEALTQEAYDGTGEHIMYSRRPIKELDLIEFRYLPDDIQETYSSDDIMDGVTFKVGKRRIYSRVFKFPRGYDNVLLSYTASANQPFIAKQAVSEAVAMIWRNRGSEDARSEQKGTFQHVLLRGMKELKFWPQAIESLHIPVIG